MPHWQLAVPRCRGFEEDKGWVRGFRDQLLGHLGVRQL